MSPPGFNEVQSMLYVSFVLLKAFGTILDWDRHSECQPLWRMRMEEVQICCYEVIKNIVDIS